MHRTTHGSHFRLEKRRIALDLPRLTLQADLDSLADSMLGMRAIQALDNDPTLFPVHRVLRFAVRRPLEEVFDDLALYAAPRAQRLEEGAVVIEGDGFLASATGLRKTDYSSGSIRVWARDLVRLREVEADILRAIGNQMVREEQFTIDWHFHAGHGGLTNVSFDELADPPLIDEAYPSIAGGVAAFIERYLEARDTILVLLNAHSGKVPFRLPPLEAGRLWHRMFDTIHPQTPERGYKPGVRYPLQGRSVVVFVCRGLGTPSPRGGDDGRRE